MPTYSIHWVQGWHPIRLFLRATGYRAITMPWRTIYFINDPHEDMQLLRHEEVHIEQISRMGPVTFTLTYLWYLLRYGYENHPLEIEARRLSQM